MATNKVVFGGVTKIDLTDKTVAANKMLDGTTSLDKSGAPIIGNIANGSASTPATTITANPTISVNASGLITASVSGSQSVTPSVAPGYITSGTSGTVSVSGSNTQQLTTQAGSTIAPTESAQTAVSAGVFTTGAVQVGAIPSNYVGSGITTRSSSDLTVSGDTVTAPAGYYASSASKAVASGTAGTPTATKSAVSNHAVTVTPSVINTTGYITGGTKTGTAVSVSASELVSGTKSITANGTGIDVTDYQYVDVNVAGGGGAITITDTLDVGGGTIREINAVTLENDTVTASTMLAGTTAHDAQGNAITGNIPSLSAQTIHPSSSDQTIASGRYLSGTQTIKGVTVSGLSPENIKDGVTVKIGDSTDDDCVTSVTGTYSGGGGMNVQMYLGSAYVTSTSYTATAVSLTVAKTGTYNVSWTGWRNTNSGTSGSQLYRNGSSSDTAHTTFTNTYGQVVQLTGQTFNQGDVLVVRARARSTSYSMTVANLIIEQTA